MIRLMLTRTVVADKSVAHLCQVVCSLVAGLVLALGVRGLANADLTEPQLFSAMTGTLSLTGVFILLAFQCRAWRRAA